MVPKLINNSITKIKELCSKYNVLSVHLFGSALTKEFNENSDIDLLVDFKKDSFHAAFNQFMNYKADMEDLFQRRVDLISRSNIPNQILKSEIDSSKVQIYAA
jgi:uncharacterized protein